MISYRKLYYMLVGSVDDALTLLEHGDPFAAKELLQKALLDTEEIIIGQDEGPEEA